jgi:hypothetical protein
MSGGLPGLRRRRSAADAILKGDGRHLASGRQPLMGLQARK